MFTNSSAQHYTSIVVLPPSAPAGHAAPGAPLRVLPCELQPQPLQKHLAAAFVNGQNHGQLSNGGRGDGRGKPSLKCPDTRKQHNNPDSGEWVNYWQGAGAGTQP